MQQELKQVIINLGKINLNKVKYLIGDLKFKGQGRKEIKSYLEFGTDIYKESEIVLTSLFGECDQEIINFLNGLYDKYSEINESNFKEFMQEIKTYSENYKYKVVDIRKTKEELIKQKTERETERKKEKEQKAKQEAEIKASGNLTQTEKINLSTKEIAKRIREKLKDRFKSCVFSVTMESYSGGSSISVYLMNSNFKVIQEFKDLSEEATIRYLDNGMRTREQLKKMQEGKYFQLNPNIDDEYNKNLWNNGVFLTEEGHNLFKEVSKIVNYYNYDNSDIQTDYFDVNFYFHLNIGKWDKPYIYSN